MDALWTQSAASAINLIITVWLTFRSARYIGTEGRPVSVVFFFFGIIGLMLSEFYWIAFDLIHPGMRMPFAANEFAEAAAFLLFSSAISALLVKRASALWKETLSAALFAAANTALWIAWSGEWIQDILIGLALGSFICAVARYLVEKECISGREGIFLGIGAAALILLQTLTFFTPERTVKLLEMGAYVLMFAGALFFACGCARALRRGAPAKKLLGLACGGYGWGLCCMYMSEGYCYAALLFYVTLQLPLMLHAFRKEAEEA